MARRPHDSRYDAFDALSDLILAFLKPFALLFVLYLIFLIAELLRP